MKSLARLWSRLLKNQPPAVPINEFDRSYDADDGGWTVRSIQAEDLTPTFRFLLRDAIYVGDPHGGTQVLDANFYRPIVAPSFTQQLGMSPDALDLLGQEEELADYYLRVGALVPPQKPSPDYWLNMGLEGLADTIRIPYYQLSESSYPIDWIKDSSPSEGFLDLEEGWVFRAFRVADRLHFAYSAGQPVEVELSNLSVDREAFLRRLEKAENAARTVVAKLKEQLGYDFWS